MSARRGAALIALAAVSLGCAAGRAGSGAVARWRRVEFSWPAAGQITSRFGRRGDSHHDGIDIAAPEGTAVRAAAAGVVVFSGVLRGYGNVIVLEHPYGLATVYAHNQRNLVRVGARVRRGALIARLGRTGRATGPNLHFEVRRGKLARDPLWYLPRPAVARRGPGGIGG